MQDHVLTQDQARRLNVPELAGKTVQVTLKTDTEKHPDDVNVPIAKDVFYKEERIGGVLSLDE